MDIFECNRSRKITIDILRGCAIICMIVGHCIQYLSGAEWENTGSFVRNKLFMMIYSFHMPLFIFISGYLFYFSLKKYTFVKLLTNKSKRILLPLVTFNILSFLLDVLVGRNYISYGFSYYFERFYNSLWFLWALLYCCMVVAFVNKFGNDKIIIYALIIFGGLFVPDVWQLRYFKYMFPYFLIAYFCNKNGENIRNFLNNLGEFLEINCRLKLIFLDSALCIIFIKLFESFNFDSYIYWSGCYLFNGKGIRYMAKTICYRYVIGLVGILMITILMNIIVDAAIYFKQWIILNALKVIAQIGSFSMGIYFFSDLAFKYGIKEITKNLSTLNYGILVIEVIVLLTICSLITWVIRKIEVLNKIVLGGNSE